MTGDVSVADARKEIIKKVLAETMHQEMADAIEPQLEFLREKRGEMKRLRQELKQSVEDLSEQTQVLQEAQGETKKVESA